MPTLAAGNKQNRRRSSGFTLLELVVVIALIALAASAVSLSLRSSGGTALERDAERLAALLETGRARARANGVTVIWYTQGNGSAQSFLFVGLPPPGLPQNWLSATTRAASNSAITLGPEPLIEPHSVALSSTQPSGQTLWVVTDGLRPFKVQNTPEQRQP